MFHSRKHFSASSTTQMVKLAILSILVSLTSAADETIVVPSGSSVADIQNAINRADSAGGGVVILEGGEYQLNRALDLSGKKNITLVGKGNAVLKAAPQQVAVVTEDVDAGARSITIDKALDIPAGIRFEIHSPGREVVKPDGSKFTTQYIMGQVDRIDGKVLYLSSPLKYAAPKGVTLISVFNGVVVRNGAKNVTIQNISIDMNRDAWSIAPNNHTYHCALMAQGSYSYETGPTGPPVEGLKIIDCTISNAHERGIAFYSVIHSGVYHSRIENTGSEGIVFDHFSYHCEAVGNTLTECRNIELNDASNCLVANNRIIRPDVGITVWQWCQLPGLNERNLIIGNEISNSRSDGISLRSGSDRNTVQGNTVTNSGEIGILIEGEKNLVTGNQVTGSKAENIRFTNQKNTSIP